MYSAFGVVSPFLPAYLGDRGLTAQQIALVVGLGTAVRLASGPLVGRLADQHQTWRKTLVVCAGGASVMALAYVPVRGVALILLVSLAQSALLAPLAPIADAMALSASLSATDKTFEYGWVRGGGSAAFIVGSIVAGQAAASQGLVASIWLNAILLAAAALAALPAPNISVNAAPIRSEHTRDFFLLMQMPRYRRLLLVGAL